MWGCYCGRRRSEVRIRATRKRKITSRLSCPSCDALIRWMIVLPLLLLVRGERRYDNGGKHEGHVWTASHSNAMVTTNRYPPTPKHSLKVFITFKLSMRRSVYLQSVVKMVTGIVTP